MYKSSTSEITSSSDENGRNNLKNTIDPCQEVSQELEDYNFIERETFFWLNDVCSVPLM